MITIISGTNRPGSNTLVVAEAYQGILDNLGVKSELISLVDLPSDTISSVLYKDNPEDKPVGFKRIQEKIYESEKLIFVIPEYNGSFPGVLKTFVDGLKYPRSFKNKRGAMVGISNGTQGAAMAMSHFADVLNYLGMHTLAMRPRFTSIDKSVESGQLSNDRYYSLLERQAKLFIDF